MSRRPKPFPHRGWYVTNAGGERTKLCRVEEGYRNAELALARLLVEQQDRRKNRAVLRPVYDLVDEFLDMKKVERAEATYEQYRYMLKPFRERYGMRMPHELTLQDGLAYKTWLLGQKYANVTVNHHLRSVRIFISWAMKPSRAYFRQNPWLEVGLLPEKPRERLITDEEFRHLLDNCGGGEYAARDFRELLSVLRHTTCRPGEVRQLRWEFVRWDTHQIHIPPELVKTRRKRFITMVEITEKVLRERWERKGSPKTGFIFTTRTGQPISAKTLTHRFRSIFQRCVRKGLIEEYKGGEKLVVHSMRHASITMLFTEKNNLPTVMREAGHINYRSTQRYEHLSDSFVSDSVRNNATNRGDCGPAIHGQGSST
jgi:integrase